MTDFSHRQTSATTDLPFSLIDRAFTDSRSILLFIKGVWEVSCAFWHWHTPGVNNLNNRICFMIDGGLDLCVD